MQQRVLVDQVDEGGQDGGDAPRVHGVADEPPRVPRLSHAPGLTHTSAKMGT